jgi:flagellin
MYRKQDVNMISFQTNYASMVAENNLQTNSNFQTKTIEALTSGYRINSSGDDAAGLAVANSYRSSVAELTQGVLNANDGVGQLQIADGGLSNISTILDRLKTLATESASTTFTGDRSTLNNEYQSLLTEIDRQASNIGLSTGGSLNAKINVYIGGGNTQANSEVNVDLSGNSNVVTSAGLGLTNTNLLGAGVDFGTLDLNNQTAILTGNAGGASQNITFNLAGGNTVTATISSNNTAGITVSQAVEQLNNQLSSYGISATVDSGTGALELSSSNAFSASAGNTGSNNGLVTDSAVVDNTALYVQQGAASFTAIASGDTENLAFTSGGGSVTVSLNPTNAGTLQAAAATLNNALSSLGISAVENSAGTGIEFQSSNTFTVSKAEAAVTAGGVVGVFADSTTTAITDTSTSPSTAAGSTSTSASLSAVSAVDSAVEKLGLVQGRVGAGENTLNYAIQLATSQSTNDSSAESQIRDADVASEAANLTKSQVLEQSSVAAMAQANTSPEYLLKLLQ